MMSSDQPDTGGHTPPGASPASPSPTPTPPPETPPVINPAPPPATPPIINPVPPPNGDTGGVSVRWEIPKVRDPKI